MSTVRFVNGMKGIGILLGAAVGDALGWPQEDRSQIVGGKAARDVPAEPSFRRWDRNGGTQFARYIDPVDAGFYSDDTQLLLSVARAALRGEDWYDWLTRVELPIWPVHQRGGGAAVLRAARQWADGVPPWIATSQREEERVARYFNAGANGVAMRIAPHAVLTALRSPDELLHRVIRDGLTTHGHPRALLGACLHALAIRYALLHQDTLEYGQLLGAVAADSTWRDPQHFISTLDADWSEQHRHHMGPADGPPENAWNRAVHEVDDLFSIAHSELSRGATGNDQRALKTLGCFDKATRGSGTVTAVAAIFVAARTAPRPLSGLLRTAFLSDADTDTLCSMTGSLLGAIHGYQWLGPLAEQVQDGRYVGHMGRDLAEAASDAGLRGKYVDTVPVATTTRDLKRWSDELFETGYIPQVPDGRPWNIKDRMELQTKGHSKVRRVIGTTVDGQTLIIDKATRPPTSPNSSTADARGARQHAPNASAGEVPATVPGASKAASAVATVEIAVTDLKASARFFAEVIGLDTRIRGNRAFIGSTLELVAGFSATRSVQPGGPVVRVLVPNLAQVQRRAEAYGGVRVEPEREGLLLQESGSHPIIVIAHEADDGTTTPRANVATANNAQAELFRD